MDIIQSCKIIPGYRSDHSRIELDLVLNLFTKGITSGGKTHLAIKAVKAFGA